MLGVYACLKGLSGFIVARLDPFLGSQGVRAQTWAIAALSTAADFCAPRAERRSPWLRKSSTYASASIRAAVRTAANLSP